MQRNVMETKVRPQFLSLILLVANDFSRISHSTSIVLVFGVFACFPSFLNTVFEGVELQVARIIFSDDRLASFLPDVSVALAVVS